MMALKTCPEPSCSKTFKSGKAKRRHVYKRGHDYGVNVTHCTTCNEPFLSEGARSQHMVDRHCGWKPTLKLSTKKPTRSSKKANNSKNKLYSIASEMDLNTFVASEVQITSTEKASYSSAIDRLVHFLQNNTPRRLRPRQVIKGGSLGKGTSVKGKSDIDLTLVMNGISDISSMQRQLPDILSELRTCLTLYSDATVTGVTSHAVQVELTGHGDSRHSVDILPALNLDFDTDEGRQVYQKMGQESNRRQQFYSTSISPLQLEIMKELPTKVKDLIRLVKYWKKENITGKKAPTSYVLELVVLHRWENNGSPTNFSMMGALKDVLLSLTQHSHFHFEFDGLRKYTLETANPSDKPYIIDPTNPYNDVYHGLHGKPWNWKQVAHEAHVWLRQSLFRGRSSSWKIE